MMQIERLFGPTLVKHVFGYITASRNGLSAAELLSVLNRNSVVLKSVFQVGEIKRNRVWCVLSRVAQQQREKKIIERGVC